VPPLVIQTENLPPQCSDWLADRCDLHTCPADSPRFSELLPEAEGLVIRTYTTVDREMIALAKNLKVIGRAGVGIDNIDLAACKANNIRVVHTPEANTEAVVEFVLSTMLPKLRPPIEVESPMDLKEWLSLRDRATCNSQYNETTLGILGFGRIGSRLGRIAKLMGFRVLFCDILKIKETYGCEVSGLDTLLGESDVISIHVDGREANKHLCNATFFAKMKTPSLFINTARGFIVDSKSLANYLHLHQNSSASLDVHDPEPITSEYPLVGLSNVALYPHIAGKTHTASTNMGWVVKDVYAIICGEQPRFEASL